MIHSSFFKKCIFYDNYLHLKVRSNLPVPLLSSPSLTKVIRTETESWSGDMKYNYPLDVCISPSAWSRSQQVTSHFHIFPCLSERSLLSFFSLLFPHWSHFHQQMSSVPSHRCLVCPSQCGEVEGCRSTDHVVAWHNSPQIMLTPLEQTYQHRPVLGTHTHQAPPDTGLTPGYP